MVYPNNGTRVIMDVEYGEHKLYIILGKEKSALEEEYQEVSYQ